MEPLEPSGLGLVEPQPPPPESEAIEQAAAVEAEGLAILAGEQFPGEHEESISLSKEQREKLERELVDMIDAYDSALVSGQKLERWKSINDAYNLVPDPDTQGIQPGHARLVSGMTRSKVNVATARLVETIRSAKPLMKVEVSDDLGDDATTEEALKDAKAAESFLEFYGHRHMKVDQWLPNGCHRLTKLGDVIPRVMWSPCEKTVYYWDKDRKVQKKTVEEGRIKVELIPNQDVIVWPLDAQDASEAEWIGHRSHLTPARFRLWARKKGISREKINELIDMAASGGSEEHNERTEVAEADLAGKDQDLTGASPYEGEINLIELWGNQVVLPDETDPVNCQLFMSEDTSELLWIGYNTIRAGDNRHPYFKLSYSKEDGSFWSSGVGHEVMYQQAGGSTLWNLFIDNLKIISNHLRILKATSMAEAMRDQIGPGYDLVTENPEGDIRIEPLGGDLKHITDAMDRNEFESMTLSGITSTAQGFGDPILKSGASPSSIGMLLEQAGKKFGHTDTNVRLGLSEIYMYALELIQQYAPDGILFREADPETAQRLRELRYRPPSGNLRRRFRIRAKAPSAATSKETLKQHLFILANVAGQHVQQILQLAQMAYPQKPASLIKVADGFIKYLSDLHTRIVEEHDLPELKDNLPRLDKGPDQMEQIANEMMLQVQQLTQELEQNKQQLQEAQMLLQQMQPPPMAPAPGPMAPPGVPGV